MLLHQVIHDEPPSPRKLNSRVPRDLETICLKCLEKDPARRYATAADVAAELRRFLDGRPILARPLSTTGWLWRLARRNRAVAALCAAVAFALLAGIVVSTWFALRESVKAQAELNQRLRADGEARRAKQTTALAQAESRRAFRNFYTAQMNLAQRDYELDRLDAVRDRLETLRPERTGGDDLRGFEWHYWRRLLNSERQSLSIPFDTPFTLNHDGTRITGKSDGNRLRVWQTAGGGELAVMSERGGKARPSRWRSRMSKAKWHSASPDMTISPA